MLGRVPSERPTHPIKQGGYIGPYLCAFGCGNSETNLFLKMQGLRLTAHVHAPEAVKNHARMNSSPNTCFSSVCETSLWINSISEQLYSLACATGWPPRSNVCAVSSTGCVFLIRRAMPPHSHKWHSPSVMDAVCISNRDVETCHWTLHLEINSDAIGILQATVTIRQS